MRIDPATGSITLPNGGEVGPELTQADFLAAERFAGARREDHGTLPWIHYHFSGGRLEGRELLASLASMTRCLST
jgi:hypothetical protein